MEATDFDIQEITQDLKSLTDDELDDLLWAIDRFNAEHARDIATFQMEAKLSGSMEGIKAGYYDEMNKLTKDLAHGNIQQNEFEMLAHDLILDYFTQAYEANRGRELDAGDEEWLNRAVSEELGYATKFGEDIVNKTLRLSREQRVGMYASTLDGIGWHAKIEKLPDDSRFEWKLGNAEHCVDCLLLACVLNDNLRVLTNRGNIPMSDVRIGDKIFTHRLRWKRVLSKQINSSTIKHRYCVLVGIDGRLIGLTDDHRLWTRQGWMKAKEVADANERCLFGLWKVDRSSGTSMQVLCGETSRRSQKVFGVENRGLHIHKEKGSIFGGLLHQRREENGMEASLDLGNDQRSDSKGDGNTSQERNKKRRQTGKSGIEGFQTTSNRSYEWSDQSKLEKCKDKFNMYQLRKDIYTLRKEQTTLLSEVCNGNENKENECCGDLCEMQEGICSEGLSCETEVWSKEEQKCFLLSELLSEMEMATKDEQDGAVWILWKGIRDSRIQDQIVEIGQVLLLDDLLSEGTPLYDLTVEDDNSFILEGMVLHNSNSPYTKNNLPTTPRAGSTACKSNCKCHLEVTVGELTPEEELDAEEYKWRKEMNLSELLDGPEPPNGMRRPTEDERKYIDDLTMKMNQVRREIGNEDLSPEELADAIAKRKEYNSQLIQFEEEHGIYDVPIWSVDDVLDGRHVGRRVVQDIFRHGIDGRTLDLFDKKKLLSLLDWYETQIGTVWSDEIINSLF